MIDRRTSGILLHPSSLPGPAEHGDFGPAARRFVDWLVDAGQHLWQVLPLSPPGGGESPYTALSVRAGNPLLVSPEELVTQGLLDAEVTMSAMAQRSPLAIVDSSGVPSHAPAAGPRRLDFDRARHVRMALLRQAAAAFNEPADSLGRDRFADLRREFDDWLERHDSWANDYSLFMALASSGLGTHWIDWPADLREREPAALTRARFAHATECDFWLFVQWQFDRQWTSLHDYARARDVSIVGDMPIYCSLDSVDVWQHPELFQLDDRLMPRRVAGVPPDYFSATGQLWGNPLYAWEVHARNDFAWWRARMARALEHADIVRIDHFRGLAAYWSVAAEATDARDGFWVPGPGASLFDAVARDHINAMPIIAEDLGVITADVTALRDAVGLPGMAVLQFAFGDDADNLYLPHRLRPATVLYTGTHDNDTSIGWFADIDAEQRERVQVYLKCSGQDISWDLIHAASASVARLAIYPMQDVLCLASEARMNVPGVAGGQWNWRFEWHQLQDWQTRRLRDISTAHGRHPPRMGQ